MHLGGRGLRRIDQQHRRTEQKKTGNNSGPIRPARAREDGTRLKFYACLLVRIMNRMPDLPSSSCVANARAVQAGDLALYPKKASRNKPDKPTDTEQDDRLRWFGNIGYSPVLHQPPDLDCFSPGWCCLVFIRRCGPMTLRTTRPNATWTCNRPSQQLSTSAPALT